MTMKSLFHFLFLFVASYLLVSHFFISNKPQLFLKFEILIAIYILWNIEVIAHRISGGHGHSHDIATVEPDTSQNSNLIISSKFYSCINQINQNL